MRLSALELVITFCSALALPACASTSSDVTAVTGGCVPTELQATRDELTGVTPGGIAYLRTPDAAFAAITGMPGSVRYANVSGLRMAYADAGPPSGKVVLLLHGEPTSSYLYRGVITTLATAGYRVIAPDLIGFGRSDKPAARAAHTYSGHVAWLYEFVSALGLTDINLVVHDWGGLFGLRLAAEHPERFATLTITNTALPTVSGRALPARCPELPRGSPVIFTSFDEWQAYSQRTVDLRVADVIEAGTVSTLSLATRAAYDAPFPSEAYKAGPHALPSLAFTEPMQNQAAWTVLQQWSKPTQVIWAPADPILGNMASQFQNRIPGTAGRRIIEIPVASHFLTEDQPQLVADAILGFLRVVSRP
jgi:haloalkane dehalogenase